ncbi:hypothetical protein [Roseibium sp. MMSF_3544]|nr:hypothetical protein [Roseibium sp. MMSF_3544]
MAIKAASVDIRDARELGRDGRIPKVFLAPRGGLRFWAQPGARWR